MTFSEMMRWRKQILAGKNKYYPKELIEKVRNMVKKLPTEQEKSLKEVKDEEEKRLKQAKL